VRYEEIGAQHPFSANGQRVFSFEEHRQIVSEQVMATFLLHADSLIAAGGVGLSSLKPVPKEFAGIAKSCGHRP